MSDSYGDNTAGETIAADESGVSIGVIAALVAATMNQSSAARFIVEHGDAVVAGHAPAAGSAGGAGAGGRV